VLLTTTGALTWGDRNLNQADHRAVALGALGGVEGVEGAEDAGSRWIFPELAGEGLEPWPGVRSVYVLGSDTPTTRVTCRPRWVSASAISAPM